MLRKLLLICVCLCSIPALCESGSSAKYQIATILAVNPHSSDANTVSSPSFDLSAASFSKQFVVRRPMALSNIRLEPTCAALAFP